MKKKVLTALLSLVMAIGVWLYVVTVVSPESDDYYYVPVVLEGESVLADRGLMITSNTDVTVKLRLSGSRVDLKKLNNGNINVVADLSKIYDEGNHSLQYTVSFPGDIPSNAVKELSKSPDRIELTVENRNTKYVPVKVDYSGTAVPEGFIADKENAILNVTSIPVTGPESIINEIDAAYIAVDLTDQTESISDTYHYILCNKAGEPVDLKELVTTNVTEVRLSLKIEQVKEVGLRLNVVDGGGATEKTSSIQVEPKTIRVSGSEAVLDKLEYIELGPINLGELTQDTVLTFPVKLPDGVTNLTGVNEVKVKISFPDLRMKDLVVTNIIPKNVPAGMEVDMVTQALTVKVRGPADLINSITADNLTVTVDFDNVAPGTATVKAQIAISPEFAKVGEVGTYSVSATLLVPEDKKE